MNNHTEFILTPITDVLKDVVSASAGIGSGIETFPLCDYVMQSVFIKMTGFQEQKLKCICWELASNDYEYRHDYTTKPLGERSSYTDKQIIYKDLIKQVKKVNPDFNLSKEIRTNILNRTTTEIKDRFLGTNLSIWAQKSFNEYFKIWGEIKLKHFATDSNSLLTEINNNETSLKKIYEDHLYKRRNRIAHNTQSYQQNLPTLKTLVNEEYRYENYFVYFAILVLMDNIFIELYDNYLIALEYKTN